MPPATPTPNRAEDEPEIAQALNVDGARAVAACARKLGVPLIHLPAPMSSHGSSECALSQRPNRSIPLAPTGGTKARGERRASRRSSADSRILRVRSSSARSAATLTNLLARRAADEMPVRRQASASIRRPRVESRRARCCRRREKPDSAPARSPPIATISDFGETPKPRIFLPDMLERRASFGGPSASSRRASAAPSTSSGHDDLRNSCSLSREASRSTASSCRPGSRRWYGRDDDSRSLSHGVALASHAFM